MAGLKLFQQVSSVSQHCWLAAQHFGSEPGVSADHEGISVRHWLATVRTVSEGHDPTIEELAIEATNVGVADSTSEEIVVVDVVGVATELVVVELAALYVSADVLELSEVIPASVSHTSATLLYVGRPGP